MIGLSTSRTEIDALVLQQDSETLLPSAAICLADLGCLHLQTPTLLIDFHIFLALTSGDRSGHKQPTGPVFRNGYNILHGSCFFLSCMK